MSNNELAAELLARCMGARIAAHLIHLETASRSDHMAVQQIYQGIEKLTDDMAQSYQGKHGLVNIRSAMNVEFCTCTMQEFIYWLEKNAYEVCDDGFFKAQVDLLLALMYDAAGYQMNYLK